MHTPLRAGGAIGKLLLSAVRIDMSSECNQSILSKSSAKSDVESLGLHCVGFYPALVKLMFQDKVLFHNNMHQLSNDKQSPNTFLEV